MGAAACPPSALTAPSPILSVPRPQAPGGVPRLMAHPWFKSINWAQLREGGSTMPLLLRDRLFNSAGAAGVGAAGRAGRGGVDASVGGALGCRQIARSVPHSPPPPTTTNTTTLCPARSAGGDFVSWQPPARGRVAPPPWLSEF
jgi:hypothetical protein